MEKSLLNLVMDDLKELRGKEVKVFGQPTKLFDTIEEDDGIIDILDVLNYIKEYEFTSIEEDIYLGDEYIDTNITEFTDVEVFYNWLDLYEYEEVKRDNSYNWGSPLSNDIDFTIYHNITLDEYYVTMKIHMYGDVRSNYTEEFILKYDHEYDFYESLHDCNKYWSYTDEDGVVWYCDINIFSDSFDISVENSFNYGDDYTCDIETYEDFIKYVNTRINEFKGIEE